MQDLFFLLVSCRNVNNQSIVSMRGRVSVRLLYLCVLYYFAFNYGTFNLFPISISDFERNFISYLIFTFVLFWMLFYEEIKKLNLKSSLSLSYFNCNGVKASVVWTGI